MPVGGGEDEVPVLPGRSRGEALGCLGAAVGPELGDERGWESQDELGFALPGFHALAASEVPVAAGALRAFAAVAGAAARARPFHLRAAVPARGAVGGAIWLVLVPGAAFRAWHAMMAGRARSTRVPIAELFSPRMRSPSR